MMNIDYAEKTQKRILSVVSELSILLRDAESEYSTDEYARLHRFIGTIIGEMQMEILEPIYAQYPQLDDLS
jgi:hypothetical protein